MINIIIFFSLLRWSNLSHILFFQSVHTSTILPAKYSDPDDA
jgi:hypothetical protein